MAGRDTGKRRRGRTTAERIRIESSVGTVELVPDPSRGGGRLLLIDGTTHGYVDLSDPNHLELDYIARIGAALEVVLPRGSAARVLHIGGGAFTLPRYIAASRPAAQQVVIERSAAIVQLAQRQLRLRTGPHLEVITGDAATRTAKLAGQSFDLIIGDAFVGTQTPPALSGDRFAQEVVRLLVPGGAYLLNVVDQPPWSHAAEQVGALGRSFAHVVAFGGREVVTGRHAGNLMLLASDTPLPGEQLARHLAAGRHPARLVDSAKLSAWL